MPPFKLKDNLDVQVSKPWHVRPPLTTQNMQHCVNCSGDRGKHVLFFLFDARGIDARLYRARFSVTAAIASWSAWTQSCNSVQQTSC